jgi:hypothetical protein
MSAGLRHISVRAVTWNRDSSMPRAWFFTAIVVLTAALTFVLRTQRSDADESADLVDFTDTSLADLRIKPVEPRKDPNSGFIVGGKNPTALIEALKEINGRTIGDLEHDMRPGANAKAGSDKGFLGDRERLLKVMATDNETVVQRLKQTHQTLAIHLLAAAAIGEETKGGPFRYCGRRFKVTVRYSRGFQLSPFHDDAKTNADATIENLDNGKKLDYSLLVPLMIERYGFYEGKGTPYRVDPERIVEVLDFLKEGKVWGGPRGSARWVCWLGVFSPVLNPRSPPQ